MRKVKQLIHCHPVVEMPPEVSHRKNRILIIEIISTAMLDILSFSIKGAQSAIARDLNLLAFIFILLYFLKDVLRATVSTFTDAMKNRFNEQHDSYIVENVSNIADSVRGKVFSQEDGFSRVLTNPQVIEVMKEFISYIWQYLIKVPTAVSNGIIAVGLAIGIMATELIQTKDLVLTLWLSGILVFCMVIFIFLHIRRLKIAKNYRDTHRKLRLENAVLYNDVKNIEPLIKPEFLFRVRLLVANLSEKRKTEKKQDFRLNVTEIIKAIVLTIFMVSIIVIKLISVGGIDNLSLAVVTDIFAISSVYSTILNKIVDILRSIESMTNILKDAESVKPKFDNVMSVFEKEKSAGVTSDQIVEEITIDKFSFSYATSNSVYTLKNSTPFTLDSGKSYLVYGHTGCGKSTLMHILTGKIKLNEAPISYGKSCQRAYLASIMHESNGKLGSNPVLEELIFSKDFSIIDMPKLISILKGTHIYEDVMRNLGLKAPDDSKVIEYLKKTTIEQYSSGQKQRLAIVKVLYNLAPSHQIVVFDEATNALDNETAESVLRFMAEYCQKDLPRIVFFVTHQVDITRKVTDGSITFKMENFPEFEICTSN